MSLDAYARAAREANLATFGEPATLYRASDGAEIVLAQGAIYHAPQAEIALETGEVAIEGQRHTAYIDRADLDGYEPSAEAGDRLGVHGEVFLIASASELEGRGFYELGLHREIP